MKKSVFALIAALTCTWISAFGWGKVGHDATAYIAECHLTPQAKANIEKYLGGRSIVFYASWLDMVSKMPEYAAISKGHTYSVDENGQYAPREGGDAISVIKKQIELLKDYKNQPDSVVAVGIKVLVHAIGDMHCPAHTYYPERSQKFYFKVFDKSYRFHPFWDSTSLEGSHRWYYVDYQYQLDRYSDDEREALAKGSLEDWAAENARNCNGIYQWTLPDADLDKAESLALMMKVGELADSQIIKGSYRLARILNELFDN